MDGTSLGLWAFLVVLSIWANNSDGGNPPGMMTL